MTNSRFFAIALLLVLTNTSPAWAKSAISHSATATSAVRARANATPPNFNIEPSCRAAIQAGDSLPGRTESGCTHDENDAKNTLAKEWKQFSTGEKSQCLTLENAGGPPSYVEILTCLEMGKAVAQLPKDTMGQNGTSIQPGLHHRVRHARQYPSETTGSAPGK